MKTIFVAALLLGMGHWCAAIPADSNPEASPSAPSLPTPDVGSSAPVEGVPLPLHDAVQNAVTKPTERAESSCGAEVEYVLRRTLRKGRLGRRGGRLPGVELSAWYEVGDDTLSVTGDVELKASGREGRQRETEIYVSRSFERGHILIEPGFSLYLRNHDLGPTTGELSLSLTRRAGAWRFFADGFLDVASERGDYLVDAGVLYRFWVGEHSLIKTSLALGRSSEGVAEFSSSAATETYAEFTLSWTRDLSSHLALRPRIEATRTLGGRQAETSRTYLKFGLALSVS